jgi:hypothetical protein
MKYKFFSFLLLITIMVMVSGCVQTTAPQSTPPASSAKGSTAAPSGEITIPGVSFQINVPGPNPLQNKTDGHNQISGILMGIWHGVISPITLVMSFVNPANQMYEVHNDGSPYNFGFLFGVALIFLFLGASLGSRRR